jgi:hypothetical protein
MEEEMVAYNVVRFRTKPGKEQEFIEIHKNASFAATGFRKGALVKTGDRDFCLIGEWDSFEDLAGARSTMIGILNSMRELLEDLGDGRGVTDPVSGSAVVELGGKG